MLKHKTIFKSAQQNSASIVIKCPLTFSGGPFLFLFFFFFYPSYSGMQLSLICYGRFAAQWNPSGIGVIPLPPHWLSINEAILTNTFWCLWNHFWKGVFNDTSCKKHTCGCLLKVPLLRITQGFCSREAFLFLFEGQLLGKIFAQVFRWLWAVEAKRGAKKLSRRGLKTSGYTVQPVTVSPQRQTSSETFAFFISPGGFSVTVHALARVQSETTLPDQDEQQAARTASVNRVWCATCGIFITGGKVRHLNTCMQCHLHDKDERREAMVSWGGPTPQCPPGPPVFQHHPRTFVLTKKKKKKERKSDSSWRAMLPFKVK